MRSADRQKNDAVVVLICVECYRPLRWCVMKRLIPKKSHLCVLFVTEYSFIKHLFCVTRRLIPKKSRFLCYLCDNLIKHSIKKYLLVPEKSLLYVLKCAKSLAYHKKIETMKCLICAVYGLLRSRRSLGEINYSIICDKVTL